MNMRYHCRPEDVFHVHTKRCGHASIQEDYEYVEAAIALHAKRIIFTDHAPYPEDPFGNRMSIADLSEYVAAINELKWKYSGEIEVVCGLEAEYLPSHKEYLNSLANIPGMLLLLGQHFFELEPGKYSFTRKNDADEYLGLCDAMVEGIRTGLFDAVAHPDRVFRKVKKIEEKHLKKMDEVILEAQKWQIPLEKNYSSTRHIGNYRAEFWERVQAPVEIVYGIDAHSTEELKQGYGWSAKLFNLD